MASHFFLKLLGQQEEEGHSVGKHRQRAEGGQEEDTNCASEAKGQQEEEVEEEDTGFASVPEECKNSQEEKRKTQSSQEWLHRGQHEDRGRRRRNST